MIKKDGHTHTEFCPHGSGDQVESMIKKAIELGFDEYVITEHAPLPPNFSDDYQLIESDLSQASMAIDEVAPYLAKLKLLKEKYQNEITLKIGFEIDYLADYREWTKNFIHRYQADLDEIILSVHFLKGKNQKYWSVDDTKIDFKTGLLDYYADPQTLYNAYFKEIKAAITTDFTTDCLIRIGHISLIKKFKLAFQLPDQYSNQNQKLIQAILALIKAKNYQIDLNAAGLFKPDCKEQYPDDWILNQAKKQKIKFIFGSDSHSIDAVGQGYQKILNKINLDN